MAALAEGLNVIIAAPQAQSSGSSASIIGAETDGSISFERRELRGSSDIPAFAVDAAPALIALIAAHGAFGPVPDLVLSGINRGANVGRAILHSGTVGAALTGGVNGARGLAVSLDVGMNPLQCYWNAPVPFIRELLPALLQQPRGTVFNLNVPNSDGGVLELREGTLATFGSCKPPWPRAAKRTCGCRCRTPRPVRMRPATPHCWTPASPRSPTSSRSWRHPCPRWSPRPSRRIAGQHPIRGNRVMSSSQVRRGSRRVVLRREVPCPQVPKKPPRPSRRCAGG